MTSRILGATDCPFFDGPTGERFVTSASLVGSLTFPWYLKAMRRADLAMDPRFATAGLRKRNLDALHSIVQTWVYSFAKIDALDCQLDEAKIAMGVLRSTEALVTSDWGQYWDAVHTVPDRRGGEFRLPGRPWRFSRDDLDRPGIPAFRGEHNREVFAALGVAPAELERLTCTGALVADHINLGSTLPSQQLEQT